jgi:hypothetical protein
MCNARRGDLLVVTHVCSLLTSDASDAEYIMLGHHHGDDALFLYPGDTCLILEHFVGEVIGYGYRDSNNRIIERDIVMPVKALREGNIHGYIVFVRGRRAYVREHYLEEDKYGYQEMSCLIRIDESDTYP